MSKLRNQIAVNGNAGAYVTIEATIPCRKVIIKEDYNEGSSSYAPQGLRYKLPADGFVEIFHALAGSGGEIVLVSNPLAFERGAGSLVGMQAQTDPNGGTKAATQLIQLLSETATATVVQVEEIE